MCIYEMLAGEPPHTAGSAQAVIMKIITETPRPVTQLRKSVPANVAAALAKALEKLPADRFSSARDFRQALVNANFAKPTASVALAARRQRGMAAAGWGMAPVATLALGWSPFLMVKAVDRPGALRMQVITNFVDVLNQKVGK